MPAHANSPVSELLDQPIGSEVPGARVSISRPRRVSHLLRSANPRDLCQNCVRNGQFLRHLYVVFEIINIVATVAGLGGTKL